MMKSYPLKEHDNNRLRGAGGRQLSDISLHEPIEQDDLAIHPDTLRAQAEIAENAGYKQVAGNMKRAAELTPVPDALILQIYAMLRPRRASYDDLIELAEMLEQTYNAAENGRFLREAAEIYRVRGLLAAREPAQK